MNSLRVNIVIAHARHLDIFQLTIKLSDFERISSSKSEVTIDGFELDKIATIDLRRADFDPEETLYVAATERNIQTLLACTGEVDILLERLRLD